MRHWSLGWKTKIWLSKASNDYKSRFFSLLNLLEIWLTFDPWLPKVFQFNPQKCSSWFNANHQSSSSECALSVSLCVKLMPITSTESQEIKKDLPLQIHQSIRLTPPPSQPIKTTPDWSEIWPYLLFILFPRSHSPSRNMLQWKICWVARRL